MNYLLKLKELCAHPALFNIYDATYACCIMVGMEQVMNNEERTALSKELVGFRTYVNTQLGGYTDAPWDKTIMYRSAGAFHSIKLLVQLIEEFEEDSKAKGE